MRLDAKRILLLCALLIGGGFILLVLLYQSHDDTITFHPVHHEVQTSQVLKEAPGGRTIIIGDVHGCFREMQELLEKVEFQPGHDRLLFVGDLVGKGPDTIAVLQKVIEWKAICVRGNHEDIFVRYYHWMMNPNSKPPHMKSSYRKIARQLSPQHWKFILEMPLFIHLEYMNTLLVHAGFLPRVPLHEQVCSFIHWH